MARKRANVPSDLGRLTEHDNLALKALLTDNAANQHEVVSALYRMCAEAVREFATDAEPDDLATVAVLTLAITVTSFLEKYHGECLQPTESH